MDSGFNIADVVLQYGCLLFSLCIHEAAHAIVADRCGDPTARLLGRATLNPLAHIDPIGTVVMPIIMIATNVPFLFGWAKPVPVNPRNLRNIRRDEILVSAAGPLSNLAMAFTFTVLLKIVLVLLVARPDNAVLPVLFTIGENLVLINLLLALFNLIPVPPLDGGHILEPFLPPQLQRGLQQLGPFGIIIAIVVARHVLPVPMGFILGLVESFLRWGL